MTSRYSIISFRPDCVRDERINVGVVVVGDSYGAMKILDDWVRVELFCGYNPDPSLTDELRQMDREPWTVERLANLSWDDGPYQTIQFRQMAGSLLPPEQLLEDMYDEFVRFPPVVEPV